MISTDEIISKAGLGFVLVKDGLTVDVEEALRRLGKIVSGNGVDPITRLSVRSRVIEILKSGKIQGATQLVDISFCVVIDFGVGCGARR